VIIATVYRFDRPTSSGRYRNDSQQSLSNTGRFPRFCTRAVSQRSNRSRDPSNREGDRRCGLFTRASRGHRRDGRRSLVFVRDVLEVIREHNVRFMAGSIAHAAFLSLLPLLLLLLIIAGAVGNE